MARRYSWLALLVILIVAAAPLRASSIAPIQGTVAGIELCEQATCGAAIFVAAYAGQVDGRFAVGTVSVAVMHETPLPGPNLSVHIVGGTWKLQLLSGRTISGILPPGGTLFNNNGNGTFHVTTGMLILSGDVGSATFDGTLSHNTFPPTISGHISQ